MQTTHLKPKEDAMEAKCDYGSSTGNYTQRNHVIPKQNSMFQKRIFHTSEKIDVHRQIKTSLDVLQHKSINDNWEVDGDHLLSDPMDWCDKIHFILRKNR